MDILLAADAVADYGYDQPLALACAAGHVTVARTLLDAVVRETFTTTHDVPFCTRDDPKSRIGCALLDAAAGGHSGCVRAIVDTDG